MLRVRGKNKSPLRASLNATKSLRSIESLQNGFPPALTLPRRRGSEIRRTFGADRLVDGRPGPQKFAAPSGAPPAHGSTYRIQPKRLRAARKKQKRLDRFRPVVATATMLLPTRPSIGSRLWASARRLNHLPPYGSPKKNTKPFLSIVYSIYRHTSRSST
jgi:hypothetical protein